MATTNRKAVNIVTKHESTGLIGMIDVSVNTVLEIDIVRKINTRQIGSQ